MGTSAGSVVQSLLLDRILSGPRLRAYG